jgi:hypothetical protein
MSQLAECCNQQFAMVGGADACHPVSMEEQADD